MLAVISIKEPEQWDRIVRSFQAHDVYYHSGYAKMFQTHEEGEPVLFYYETDKMRAMNVVMKRDLSMNPHFSGRLGDQKYFDLITPYGYGGFLTDGDTDDPYIDELNTAYTAYCAENNIVSEYVRFHPVLRNKEKMRRMYDVEDLGKTVAMDLNSPEAIWNHFTGKNRNMVRKAQKSGVRIYWGRSPELFEHFSDMYRSTMDKNHAADYYYFKKPFYDAALHDLKHHCMIFYALWEGKVIAMSLLLFENQQMHYHLSASDRDYQHLAPTNLLLYDAACWGCANGLKTFHLGGGLHSREDNLYKFKSAFHTCSKTVYAIGKKCFHQKKYAELVAIRSEDEKFDRHSLFFPLYRL